MNKKAKIKMAIAAAVVAVLGLGCAAQRPREELISSLASPDGTHIMNVYKNSGGGTSDWSTTIAIQDVATSKEKNVYFHYHEEAPDEAVWVDNDTVRINGMELNLSDYYESFDPK